MVDINELLKKGLIKKGDDPSLEIHRLPIGFKALDDMLGGGLPMGRGTELYGPESTGKTLIAQCAVAAVQKSERPMALYMDMERTYDEIWWQQSGVDTKKLLVSDPATAEQAIDIMRAVVLDNTELGIIVLDSIAAMTPEPEMDPERSSENKTIGLQARVITLMYRQIVPILGKTIFLVTNQMRETIGAHDELRGLPGGRAQRHYNSIILRTARESWINDSTNKNHLGFYMEFVSKKNKTCNTPDGTSITLPFMFSGQIDMLTSYIEEGIKHSLIIRAGPYYKTAGQSFLGMPALRQFFLENEPEVEQLKQSLNGV